MDDTPLVNLSSIIAAEAKSGEIFTRGRGVLNSPGLVFSGIIVLLDLFILGPIVCPRERSQHFCVCMC